MNTVLDELLITELESPSQDKHTCNCGCATCQEELDMEAFFEELDEEATVKTTPTPGAYYQIKRNDNLLTVVGRAYKVGEGNERLKLAQKVNNDPANRKFWRSPNNAFERGSFKDGIISFSPRFTCGEEQKVATAKDKKCFAKIWIPDTRFVDSKKLHSDRFVNNIHLQKIANGELILKKGSKNDSIKIIQKALKDLGYDLNTDGIINEKSETAVKKFQRDSGLPVDGIIGAQTILKLDYALLSLDYRVDENNQIKNMPIIRDGYFPLDNIVDIGTMSINQIKYQRGGHSKDLLSEIIADAENRIIPIPKRENRFIKTITIDLSNQKLKWVWNDSEESPQFIIDSGKGCPNTQENPCENPNKNNSYCTPTGSFKPTGLGVGKKNDPRNYSNRAGDRMSHFVQFVPKRGIGIHESPVRDARKNGVVQGRPMSHGCIRTSGWVAEMIYNNVSKATNIIVTGKAPTKPWKLPEDKAKKNYPRC
ncbi:MAG TPA: L,D-transpeptidase family protein [Saprospiraceae bacterium]|nr:L,D-transpeptidase family protein [Saprospiraceae bacterium]HMP24852.1 L,D-transpeptidase family protein [Saprospiraceae bacterium]